MNFKQLFKIKIDEIKETWRSDDFMSSLSKAKKFTRFVEIYLSKKAKCEKVDVNFSVKMKILTIQ